MLDSTKTENVYTKTLFPFVRVLILCEYNVTCSWFAGLYCYYCFNPIRYFPEREPDLTDLDPTYGCAARTAHCDIPPVKWSSGDGNGSA
jgi:hypothetical protein